MEFNIYPKKSLGQNFLIDQNIIKKIVKIGELNNKSVVLELGAGTGNLTKEILLNKQKETTVIEKDEKLVNVLKKKFLLQKKIKIVKDDIISFINKKTTNKNITVYGNLPYNISTQILAKLILLNNWPPWYNKLILMFQKEVADRILAKSNSENFNRLAVLTNWRLDIKKHFEISNNCFFPKPKVSSTILSFTPKKESYFEIKNPNNLEKVTRILFSNPRKMINKNLRHLFKNNTFEINKLNINLRQRPKELSCETYYKITSKYEDLFK